MLALHGLDVVGLEISEKGAEAARAYSEKELADPHDYNFGSPGPVTPGRAGEVQVIAGDFFKRGWEAGASVGSGFDLVYDYTVSNQQRDPHQGGRKRKLTILLGHGPLC